jgi:processing peptidase subunit beta
MDFLLLQKKELPPYLLNIPPTKISTLSNKLRVATEEIPGETATVGIWIDAGSAYETEKNNGVAHFLEHMAFKGTKNRTREMIEKEIENMGGTLNAYTSREQTVYYAKVFKNDIPKAVNILSDILSNSTLEQENIELERGTILREMEEVNKDTSEVIFDYLHSAAYQGTSLGRTILGPEENIKNIQRNDLVEYIKTHYQAPRMVLVGAGAVKHEQLVELAEKNFSGFPSDPITYEQNSTVPWTGSMVTVTDESIEKVHMVAAVEGVPWSHPDYFTFLLLQTIVGSWDKQLGGGKNLSSVLCEKVAQEELCESFVSFNSHYNYTGMFGVYYVTEPGKKTREMTFEIFNEFNRIGHNITEEEVERAKSKMKASFLMQYDGTTNIAEDIGRQILTIGRRLSPAEIFMRIDAITVQDVRRITQNYFEDVEPAVAAIGLTNAVPDYNFIRRWTYWARI